MRSILEAYYEPQFSDRSHGFRPTRGCHTALRDVMPHGRATPWFIEGERSACCDRSAQAVREGLWHERFHDNRFLRLLGGFLRAGDLEEWPCHAPYRGVPQGGISARRSASW